jgi:alpha-ribazole phosphatase
VKLWLVRHAPAQVAPGLCYGRTDLPAQPQATAQAARTLATQLPPGLQVRTSTARRCVQLAQALQALRPDLSWAADARLQEMDFGAWEMQPWDAIGQGGMAAWMADFPRHAPGGGESVASLLARVEAAWTECRAAGQPALWITHAGVIRAVRLLAAGQSQVHTPDDWPKDPAPFGAAEAHELPPPATFSAAAPASRA